jgi:hypothetical protein
MNARSLSTTLSIAADLYKILLDDFESRVHLRNAMSLPSQITKTPMHAAFAGDCAGYRSCDGKGLELAISYRHLSGGVEKLTWRRT